MSSPVAAAIVAVGVLCSLTLIVLWARKLWRNRPGHYDD